jgi:hypothetical protein
MAKSNGHLTNDNNIYALIVYLADGILDYLADGIFVQKKTGGKMFMKNSSQTGN